MTPSGAGDRVRVVLGAEHDDALQDAVRRALREAGARQVDTRWAVGGSQVVETLEVEVAGERVVVEAETFVGLVLEGPRALVERLMGRILHGR